MLIYVVAWQQHRREDGTRVPKPACALVVVSVVYTTQTHTGSHEDDELRWETAQSAGALLFLVEPLLCRLLLWLSTGGTDVACCPRNSIAERESDGSP